MPKSGVGSRNDSGATKRKRKIKDAKITQSIQGALLKHFRPVDDSTGGGPTFSLHNSASGTSDLNTDDNLMKCSTELQDIGSAKDATSPVSVSVENPASGELISQRQIHESSDYTDVSKWPSELAAATVKYIVEKGPYRVDDLIFPLDDQRRHFSVQHYQRKMPNGEFVDRRWLVYSKILDSVFCFCCKLFFVKGNTRLSRRGHNNWQNLSNKLTEHEASSNHKECHNKWVELENRLLHNRTIDHVNEKMIDKEKKHWQSVLERLILIVQFLAQRNLSFRGSEEKLFSSKNGNFLSPVELISKFDPVLLEHLRKIENEEIKDHYLGSGIQNELIELIGNNVLKSICTKIKAAKYYSLILDCTPDLSHQEQMTVIIRYVEISGFETVNVKESFVGFLEIDDTSGAGLCDAILKKLEDLNISVFDCRGQGYDNGANMRGRNKGVQARILEINSKALFVPCGSHSWNLVLGDMAKSSTVAISFFGILQQIYVLFSASTHRWNIFKKHVKHFTVKPLSDTRWECRVDSVKAIRFQIGEIYDALVEISETSNEAKSRSESASLAKEIKDYQFLVSICIWYDILIHFNLISKIMQNRSMVISNSLAQIKNTIEFLKEYKENGFQKAKTEANKLAVELEVDENSLKFPDFNSKHRRKVKKQFLYEAVDEDVSEDPENRFRIKFFNVLLDQALMSTGERFHQMKRFEEHFGFLFLSTKHDDEKLAEQCKRLAELLGDVDGSELLIELTMLRNTVSKNSDSPLEFLQYIVQNRLQEVVPNLVIALRVLLTIPVTVASAERSFSKLKLIKTYLRSTMSQHRLNALAMISIENEISSTFDYMDIIEDFAAKNARKISL